VGTQIGLTVVFTVLPFYLLLRYYYRSDLFREPRGALTRTFLLGLATAVPALLVELGLGAIPVRSLGPIPAAAYVAFVVAAIPEEALKLLVVGRYCARLPDFDEPMDGIVYGATAGLGFAAIENALYILSGGLFAALIRGMTSVPLHATCGAVLGYYVARGRPEGRRGSVVRGFALAVVIHGLYDFAPLAYMELAAQGSRWAQEGLVLFGLVALFVVVLLSSWLGMRRLIRRLHAEQLRAAPRGGSAADGGASTDAPPVSASVEGVAGGDPPAGPGEGRTEPPDEGAAGNGLA
jgi:protease PrsW